MMTMMMTIMIKNMMTIIMTMMMTIIMTMMMMTQEPGRCCGVKHAGEGNWTPSPRLEISSLAS